MTEKKKMTACKPSVGADEKQSSQLSTLNLSDTEVESNNNFSDMEADWRETLDPNYLATITMTELYETAYAPRTPIIEELLYPGVYLFAGAPKVGKSFLVAQIGYHVSMGTPLWERAVKQGIVLYLALEDDYARLQNRLSKMFGVEGTDSFHFATVAKRMTDGLDGQLERFIRKHPNVRLIIIDTLQKIREATGEKFSYANDYEIIGKLKILADRYGVCILIVHHTRKQEADDHFDTISGTNGLLGAADGAFLLQKEKRTGNSALFDIVGRDQQDQRLRLNFDRGHCLWELTGMETELWKEPPDELLESISRIVSIDSPVWRGSPSALAEILQMDLSPNVMSRRLNVSTSRLLNEYNIRYESSRSHDGRKITLTLELPL